jgi:ABC-type microcin C transport system permease subunit YejE
MTRLLERRMKNLFWVAVVLVVFIGESVREAFDPKQYAKYE